MNLFSPKEGTLADLFIQYLKRAAFRGPGLRELARPRYNYNIEPAQLAWLCMAIEHTRTHTSNAAEKGCVVEVGVARGMTSVFLLEHMRQIRDERTYVCVDTFSGFTRRDVEHEVNIRGKNRSHYRGFSYNQKEIFESNLAKCGFKNVLVIQADAATFDWGRLPPIDVMFLDIDLYLPTKAVLENSFGRWSNGAYVMLDDVQPEGDYDGAFQAYLEFCAAKGLPKAKIGNKGGIILMQGKPDYDTAPV
jgi:hypothetical protein